jgi:hypothetical protein
MITTTTTAEEIIEAVNNAHWNEDYKGAILSDKVLIRRLSRRIADAGLSGKVTILENGPAGCFAGNLDENKSKINLDIQNELE